MKSSSPNTRRRSAPTQLRILRDIKRRIISGAWRCGERLPNRAELIARYSTSNVTIQRVMDTLQAEGFVETHGALGTYVSHSPPHLTRYGLVFPESRTHYYGPPSLFWRALSEVARDFPTTEFCQLESYYDALRGADGEDYKRLLDDIDHHRLAGLVFASPPHVMRDTPVLTATDLSRVLIAPRDDFGGLPTVYPDYGDFIHQAFDHFQAHDCRRIALLGILPPDADMQRRIESELAARGMTSRPQWQQYPSTYVPEAARHAVHLLLSHATDRPDGLLILDDNLAESGALGLLDAGVRTPDDVRVVSHVNFPLAAKLAAPVARIGFDVNDLLHTCIDILRRQTEGDAVAAHTSLPAASDQPASREALLGNPSRPTTRPLPELKPVSPSRVSKVSTVSSPTVRQPKTERVVS